MAQQTIFTIVIIGSIIIWTLMAGVIYKLFCDRHRELGLIKEIKKDLSIIKEEIKEK